MTSFVVADAESSSLCIAFCKEGKGEAYLKQLSSQAGNISGGSKLLLCCLGSIDQLLGKTAQGDILESRCHIILLFWNSNESVADGREKSCGHCTLPCAVSQ